MTAALATSLAPGDRKSVAPSTHKPFLSVTELGRRMREARMRRGYSQTQTATLLNVAKQTISNWELGSAPPMLMSLFRFAAIMDIDVAELITGLSDDLAPSASVRRRLAVASRLVPLYQDIDTAGGLLMHTGITVAPERFIAPVSRVPEEAVSFTITGRAMEPRFMQGDVVIVTPLTMAERGTLVVAYAGGKYVFRKFLPKVEGKVEGAVLRALSAEFLDIEMVQGVDVICGALVEHISHRQE